MSTHTTPENDSVQARERELIASAKQEALDWKNIPEPLASGRLLPPPDTFPGYKIIRELHRGGQGVVYEAIQLATERTIALKVMREGPFTGEKAKWRFEREVKLIASLKHPNIVVIHDSGIIHGMYYFAMDYVRGQPLDTHVRLSQLSVHDILNLFKTVCEAVNYAHRKGVIHRDLKPSNILADQDHTPYVLDFGLAKVTSGDLMESQPAFVSSAGDLIGTLAYMSPEQTMGDPEAIDIRTDVYSLGVILFELLTRTPPYEINHADLALTLKNIRESDPPRPSRINKKIDSEVNAIVLKALEKDPDRRYQSAGELAEDLTARLEGRPVAARSASSLYVLRKIAARHSFETLVVTTVILIVISFSAIALESSLRATTAEESKAQSDSAVVHMEAQADTALNVEHHPFVRQMKLWWFLLEWREGRSAEARRIQSLVDPSSAEHLSMAFLLDETYSAEQLMRDLPPEMQALGHFVVGERAAKAGKLDEAAKAFEACAASPGADLLELPAEARLKQIRSTTKPGDGGG